MTILKTLIHSHLSYHIWSIQTTVTWLRTLDNSILNRITPSSYNSINKTIQHLRKAQEFWNDFLKGNPIDSFIWKEELQEPLIELNLLIKSSEDFKPIVSDFTEEQLAALVEFNTPWASNKLQRVYFILHVINHATYHRGQIVTMARCLNVNEGIPMTEYSIFLGSNTV